MSTAWVALGANLGDPRRTLLRALRWLAALPGTRLSRASSLHRTSPVGPPQPDFLNAVARLETHLSPETLLVALLTLEQAAGRERTVHWGPRTLDLDLLLMGADGSLVHKVQPYRLQLPLLAGPDLVLPHPRLHERRFVLAPLAELDPDLMLATGLTVAQQLAAL